MSKRHKTPLGHAIARRNEREFNEREFVRKKKFHQDMQKVMDENERSKRKGS